MRRTKSRLLALLLAAVLCASLLPMPASADNKYPHHLDQPNWRRDRQAGVCTHGAGAHR